ncbi:D-2-hydroxyacid dehydrogenase [bacterium]|nr:D-2-hydroxyacid dehydrogenase [bacterium]
MKVIMFNHHWNPFWNVPDSNVNKLRPKFPEIEFAYPKAEPEFRKELSDAEIFFGYRLEPAQLNLARNLKWVHCAAANVSQFMNPDFLSRNILLTNSRSMHATPIAEHVIGAMLVFSRKFMDCWQHQQKGHYGASDIINGKPPLSELRGKTLYIIGLGGIGKETARLAKAFGMNVIASRKKNIKAEDVDEMLDAETFRDGLGRADYLLLSLPLTAESRGLIGERELALLKPECVLINIARSGVLDTKALIKFLREGRIRGANLDVFDQEPLPDNHELFSVPNLFLTPHIAGVAAQEHWDRMFWLFEENLKRYIAKKPLLNVVDQRAEY